MNLISRKGKAARSSPLALASPFGRRGDAKSDSVPLRLSKLRAASRREAVASHRASGGFHATLHNGGNLRKGVAPHERLPRKDAKMLLSNAYG
ncbi:hypothetical protein GS682_19815 [Nostoc sp. B(2019)]|nr:hypothetical protein [Nostoc sp. B(2019)]